MAAGRAMTERPDLFATAILQVGLLDAVRMIVASQNGPNHLIEMGDVKTEAGVKQLLAMSSYHNVRSGTAYPATMVITGMNDNRVDPWMSFKMAAPAGSEHQRQSGAAAGGRQGRTRHDQHDAATQRHAGRHARLPPVAERRPGVPAEVATLRPVRSSGPAASLLRRPGHHGLGAGARQIALG
ncbi:prolyl oligopeptidase family serine peptidase [Massilia sp. B-10]|nr:prolyl oligopeptidase family serine peptidase [Massilia sp. B-10]